MAKSISIKVYDGVNIITENETIFCEHIPDIWETFGWDIVNDENAKECSLLITRELIGCGFCDLSAMYGGKRLLLEVVPVKD